MWQSRMTMSQADLQEYNMKKTLAGLTILVTRPEPKNTLLCALITEYDGNAISFPTICFKPPSDINAYQAAIQALGEQEWWIFNSPQSVYASKNDIQRHWPSLPTNINIAAIGEGTAKALQESGFSVNIIPAKWNSEGLLSLPMLDSVKGTKIAIIRGEGGRELLDHTLTERGAIILPVIAYKRVIPNLTDNKFELLISEVDIVICTSGEGIVNLKHMLDEASWYQLTAHMLVVISERLKIIAEKLGFKNIKVAKNASNEAILDTIFINQAIDR